MSTVSAKGSCSPPAPFFGYGTGSSRLEVPEVFEAPAWKGGRFGQRLCTRVDGQYAAGPWLTCFSTRDSFFKAWCKASGVWCPNYILYVYTHTYKYIYIYTLKTHQSYISSPTCSLCCFSHVFFIAGKMAITTQHVSLCFTIWSTMKLNTCAILRVHTVYIYIYAVYIHIYIYAQYIHIHIYIYIRCVCVKCIRIGNDILGISCGWFYVFGIPSLRCETDWNPKSINSSLY